MKDKDVYPSWIHWVVWAVVIFLALLGAATLPVKCCEPDLVNYTPTPGLKWNPVTDADLAGYKLYYRMPGGVFQLACDFPVSEWIDEDLVTRRYWRGVDLPVQIQRCLEGYELETLEFAVKAYDTAGNVSENFSNVVTVCMPDIWVPGEVYQ